MKQRHRVFVYGTLRRGGSNHHRMAGASWLGEAKVRGRLYAVTWYPALRLDDTADWVQGDVFEMDDETLASLDAFEGDEYERVSVEPVMTDARMAWDDDVTMAWMWQWRGSVDGLLAIPTGDWLGYLQPPAKPWWAISGCVGVMALIIGGPSLLALLGGILGLDLISNPWILLLFLLMAGAFGFFSLVMSHRMREAPGSRWVGLMRWLTSIASAFSFVVGIGLALAFLVHVFE